VAEDSLTISEWLVIVRVFWKVIALGGRTLCEAGTGDSARTVTGRGPPGRWSLSELASVTGNG